MYNTIFIIIATMPMPMPCVVIAGQAGDHFPFVVTKTDCIR